MPTPNPWLDLSLWIFWQRLLLLVIVLQISPVNEMWIEVIWGLLFGRQFLSWLWGTAFYLKMPFPLRSLGKSNHLLKLDFRMPAESGKQAPTDMCENWQVTQLRKGKQKTERRQKNGHVISDWVSGSRANLDKEEHILQPLRPHSQKEAAQLHQSARCYHFIL